jgi:hypothetical protein
MGNALSQEHPLKHVIPYSSATTVSLCLLQNHLMATKMSVLSVRTLGVWHQSDGSMEGAEIS